MAIAFDTSTYGGDGVATWSHICTGVNRLLLVFINNPNDDITGITYGGVAMTQLLAPTINNNIAVYYLLNPASGSNSIVASGMGGSSSVMGFGLSYTGVQQSDFPDSFNVIKPGTSPQTNATNVITSNCWLIHAACITATVSPAGSTNRTDRQAVTNVNTPFSPYGMVAGDSNGTVAAGSESTIFTATGTGSPALSGTIVISIAPASTIGFDSSAQQANDNVTSLTWNHTCSGSNRLLIVPVYSYGAPFATTNISGVTYNGIALSKYTVTQDVGGSTLDLWYLIAPPIGTNSIVVTGAFNTNGKMQAYSMSYTGVNQSTPFDSNGNGTQNPGGGSFSASDTVVNSNCWLLGFASYIHTGSHNNTTHSASNKKDRRSWDSNTISTYSIASNCFDSGGIVPTGSNSVAQTVTGYPGSPSTSVSAFNTILLAAIQPAPASLIVPAILGMKQSVNRSSNY